MCRREVAWLQGRDRRRRLAFVDIVGPGFDAVRIGATHEQLMGAIHALRPDGTLFSGADVFREVYAQVGLGWLAAPTRVWPLRPLVDAAYRLFARHRLRIGGWFGRRDCDEGACGLDQHGDAGRRAPRA